VVVRNSTGVPATEEERRLRPAASQAQGRTVTLRIGFDLGRDFRVTGRGVDTRLAGSVQVQGVSQGMPQITGLIRTVGGTYEAYGQRMNIERGELRFTGPADNPALDILAVRPIMTPKVGVLVTGRAQLPHVELYSEAGLSEAETLSQVVLGRSSSGGGAETAVLQRAATALLAGRRGTGKGLFANLGVDDLSVRPDSTSGAVVRVGKRFADNFYAALRTQPVRRHRTLFIFYDVSRRVTVRAEAGRAHRAGPDLHFRVRRAEEVGATQPGHFNSNTRQVVVAWAYSVPSGPTRRASAVASCRPQCSTLPSARTRCTFSGTAFTRFTPEFGGGVAAARRHHGVHCAAEGRIEQRRVPAAMHRAHGIEVVRTRRALEDRAPFADLHQLEAEGAGDRRVGQFAAQHRLQHVQAAAPRHLVRPGYAAAGAGRPAGRRLHARARARIAAFLLASSRASPERLAYAMIASTIVRMDTAVKPQGCTNLKLRQLMRRVAQLYDAEVGKTGLRGTQYSLLSYVVKLGPIRPGELARVMKVDASTLTRNLRPLIDAGPAAAGSRLRRPQPSRERDTRGAREAPGGTTSLARGAGVTEPATRRAPRGSVACAAGRVPGPAGGRSRRRAR
jgi:hypothetical protein